MKPLQVIDNKAYLSPEFFRKSELCFHTFGIKGNPAYRVCIALDNKYDIIKKSLFSEKEKLIGEISDFYLDRNLNPFLKYSPIEFVGETRLHKSMKTIKLNLTEGSKEAWFKFVLDPDARQGYPFFGLYLPLNFWLDRQKLNSP
ncbi:MAG: hypothetical protein WC781_00100 [Candidatus Pacearchaeota archaeon]